MAISWIGKILQFVKYRKTWLIAINSELQFPTFTFVIGFAYHIYALSPRISDLKQSCFCFVLFYYFFYCVLIYVKDKYFEILVKLNNHESLQENITNFCPRGAHYILCLLFYKVTRFHCH